MQVTSAGIDVNSIVAQLMTVERLPLDRLTQKESDVTLRINAVSQVQGALSTLQLAVNKLAGASLYSSVRASVSGDGLAAAVTDASQAEKGSYAIKVTTLASSQALASGQFDAATDVLGNGTLTLTVGETTQEIEIDAESNTLAGVRDAINAAKAGVTASIVADGDQVRLTLTVDATGAANTVKLTVVEEGTEAADPENLDATGLSRLAFDDSIALGEGETTAPGRNLEQTRAAADAGFEVNGLALTAASNKVTGVIAGISLDLKKASDETVNLVTIDRDGAPIRAAVNEFIKAYNDLDKVIRGVTSYDPANRTAAILNGDSSVRSVQTQVRNLLRASKTPGEAGDFLGLSDVGIEVARDGTVSLNAAKFDAALADPDKLARLMTATSGSESAQGIAVRFKAFTDAALNSGGALPSRVKGLQSQIEGLKNDQERISVRLEQTEARLRKQYTALDTLLATMSSTSDSLANALSALPKIDNGNR